MARVQVVDVTARHARRATGATRWGLLLMACTMPAGVLAGSAIAAICGALL